MGDEYEEEYEEWNDYDECDWDPTTNKMTISTYSSQKKPKHKKDPLIETYQNTMKMVNRINNYNNWTLRNIKRKGNRNLYGVIVINGKELYIGTICNNYKRELYSKS